MSYGKWTNFISLIPNEKAIFEKEDVKFYFAGEINNYLAGFLLLTTKRIIGLSYKYQGFFNRKLVGYKKVEFEVYIKDLNGFWIKSVGWFGSNPLLMIKTRPRQFKSEFDIAIGFQNEEQLNFLYREISSLVLLSKEPKPIKQEIIQYNLSTKFQFDKNGALLIDCPHCSGSAPIEAKKNPVTCPYCGKEYIIPKKILGLL